MTLNLQVLAQNRDALLLAEVAAWLHDMGKCADEHIINQASDKPNGYSYKYKTAQSDRLPSSLPDINLLGETVSVKDLIEKGMPRVISDTSQPWILRTLGRCHSVAHVEKELSDRDTSTKQPQKDTRLSTAFGVEGNPVTGLTKILSGLPFSSMQERRSFVPQVERAFESTFGDTRRPINEVTLADWSGAVASLYKSAIAGALLGVKPTNPDDLRWRILRVNFDVLGLYAKAIKIADLLGYQRAVDEACERVKQLVEEKYPLGNEIYRDTTGIYFTFPDLDLPDDLAQEIRRCVEEVEMELAPRINVTIGDGDTAKEQLKKILGKARGEALESLDQPFDDQNLSVCWQQQWKTVGQGNWELCPVCRLRPKKEDEQACPTCMERRMPRVKKWLDDLSTTIWTDEVADTNGRLALIVGQFGLDDWLNGQLVQTLTVTEPQNGNADLKNPSPARLRRIWETTRAFWQAVLPTDGAADRQQSLVGRNVQRPEMRLVILPQNGVPRGVVPHHTYDLIVNNVAVSVVWDGQRFLTADNLDYLAKPEQLGQPLTQCLIQGKAYAIEEPAGYGAKNKRLGEITIGEVKEEHTSYLPAIPILAEPRTFMALVPADRALQIVQAIRCKYECEMGKVRNRLPLTLGVIYFGRRTPLAAALEAGRKMLRRRVTVGAWRVEKLETLEKRDCLPDGWPRRVALTLSDGPCSIRLEIPTVMGDDTTMDVWYPYWRLEGESTHGRQRWFKGADDGTWVHVCDLRPGDRVQFMPSTFDYEYLDTTARRFEIFYGEDGQRRGKDKPQRPYLLEEVSDLQNVWLALGRLSKSQIYQIEASIEAKRRAWGKPRGRQALELPSEDVFRRFVRDVLHEAKAYNEFLETAALSGMLSDVLELYLTIAKEEVDHDK